ncbi:hypothetical protein RFI_00784 [Reticulomyxa filosa]|uniref:E3 ubiquitin-protein ligase n=1 Tax=Reticulomyxa filosa TaxID=46433 RepID=X6PDY8_RETFI|nr:hypothetical protein RFI_00784 [Reticulomyxa filosa]|eukprot:ETO36279.1 hypothetical protein RFI_00784 [Reticulomyxa filosa]
MSTSTILSLKSPSQASKEFFDSSPSKAQIWERLEVLLWSHQDQEDYTRFFECLRELASGGRGFEEMFIKNQPSGMCGKEVRQGEPIYTCLTCATAETSVQCVECFDHADHTGHEVTLHCANGGCCDCGDPEAWNPIGFCKFHQGFEAELNYIKLEPEVERSGRLVCGFLIYLLSHAFSSDHDDVVHLPLAISRHSFFYRLFAKQKKKKKKEIGDAFGHSNFPSLQQLQLQLQDSAEQHDKILVGYGDDKDNTDQMIAFAKEALSCNDDEGHEIAWRLQMLGKTYFAVAPDDIVQSIGSIWTSKGLKTSVQTTESTYVRVLSTEFVIEMIKCIASWTSSAVLRRIISQCLMQDTDKLGNCDDKFYDTTCLVVSIPGWVDDGKERTEEPTHSPLGEWVESDYHNRYKTSEFVHETKTPLWYFMMSDYSMRKFH